MCAQFFSCVCLYVCVCVYGRGSPACGHMFATSPTNVRGTYGEVKTMYPHLGNINSNTKDLGQHSPSVSHFMVGAEKNYVPIFTKIYYLLIKININQF